MGWTVIRFWGTDIKNNTDECVRVIEETIFEMKILEWNLNWTNYWDHLNSGSKERVENMSGISEPFKIYITSNRLE